MAGQQAGYSTASSGSDLRTAQSFSRRTLPSAAPTEPSPPVENCSGKIMEPAVGFADFQRQLSSSSRASFCMLDDVPNNTGIDFEDTSHCVDANELICETTEWDQLVACSELSAGDRNHSLAMARNSTGTSLEHGTAAPTQNDSTKLKRKRGSSPEAASAALQYLVSPPAATDLSVLDIEIMNAAGVLKPMKLVSVGRRRSPRTVEYTCSACSSTYKKLTLENAWFSVQRDVCPACGEEQYPFIDIEAPINAMELDPNISMIYSEGTDVDSRALNTIVFGQSPGAPMEAGLEVSLAAGSPPAYRQCFDGSPLSTLSSMDAAKLLALFCHARTCNGRHASAQTQEICLSVKLLMLHVRDCDGTDPEQPSRSCRRAWCRSAKALVFHLGHCQMQHECPVCKPR